MRNRRLDDSMLWKNVTESSGETVENIVAFSFAEFGKFNERTKIGKTRMLKIALSFISR